MSSEADDLARCTELLRNGSKSFFAASRLLPTRVRAPTTALYAFCRQADDAVDDVRPGDARAAVESLRERLDAVYAGRPRGSPVDRLFARVVERFEIPRATPDALVEGMAWDAEGRDYETFADVVAYSARVASAVGVMMTLLMGGRSRAVLARACDLGVAMQLTNIARDVGEDARRGRVYLPARWLAAAGIDRDALRAQPVFTPALGTVVGRLLDEADILYRRSESGVPALPGDCRISIRAARLIYADIGRVVRSRGNDSVSSRATTSTLRKLWLLCRAMGARFATGEAELRAPALPETQFLVDAAGATP